MVRASAEPSVLFFVFCFFVNENPNLPFNRNTFSTDACLLRLSEVHGAARVWTTDSDFKVYRRLGRQVVPVLAPWQGVLPVSDGQPDNAAKIAALSTENR